MSFWSGRRVLVTGGAGFLGSKITSRLQAAGAEVFVPRSRDYDLTDRDSVRRAFADSRPSVVIHCAGVVGGIGANSLHPGGFFFDNLMMGVLCMETARLQGVEKFVAIGTVCCYPKLTPVPFQESYLWNGYPEETNAPYGLAKKMLLVQSQAYRQQYGFNSIFLLPTNLYGPGDNFNPDTSHVIPALILKCVSGGDEIMVWGTGNASREFLYADDCADAIVLAAERYDKPGAVNIGTGYEVTIRSLVGIISRLTGFKGVIRWDASKPDGQPRRCLDTSVAEREFGFRATTPLEKGLRATVDAFLSSRSPRA